MSDLQYSNPIYKYWRGLYLAKKSWWIYVGGNILLYFVVPVLVASFNAQFSQETLLDRISLFIWVPSAFLITLYLTVGIWRSIDYDLCEDELWLDTVYRRVTFFSSLALMFLIGGMVNYFFPVI